MNGPILVALDGSQFSEAALPWALEFSRRFGVGLDIVSVAEPIPTLEYTEWNAEAQRWTEDYVDRVAADCEGQAGGEVTATALVGPAIGKLVERAQEIAAGMVVAATHGHGPLARAWLGSVADGLLRTSGAPVLLIRPHEEGDEVVVQEPDVTSILVSLDGTPDSEAALEHARQAARAFGADLHLTQVVTYPSEVASPYLPQTVALNRELLEQSRTEAEEHLEKTAAVLRGEGLTVSTSVDEDVHGAGGIVRTADEVDADLLVMATHGRGGLRRALLGSVTDKVVRTTDRPVLVVHIPHDE